VISAALYAVWHEQETSPFHRSEWELDSLWYADEASLLQTHVAGFLRPRYGSNGDDVLDAIREEGRLSKSLDHLAAASGYLDYGFRATSSMDSEISTIDRLRSRLTDSNLRSARPADRIGLRRPASMLSLSKYVRRNTSATDPTTPGGTLVTNFAYYTKYCAIANVALIFFYLVSLMFLREFFPKIYHGNKKAKGIESNALFGWIWDAMSLTHEEIEDVAGFDQACLIRYTCLCMKLLAIVGIPLLVILVPLSWKDRALFDYAAVATGNSTTEFSVDETYSSQTCWLYAALVWWVVGLTQMMTFNEMHQFVARRFNHLRNNMPLQEAKTVLVARIHPDLRSETLLKDFFEKKFPSRAGAAVKSVNFVKRSGRLSQSFYEFTRAQRMLEMAEGEAKRTGVRPQRHVRGDDQHDTITYYQSYLEGLKKVLAITRKDFVERSQREFQYPYSDRVTTGFAFVQFNHLDDALKSRTTSGSCGISEFWFSYYVHPADPPTDIMFENMFPSDGEILLWRLLGCAMLAITWVVFAPLVFLASFATDFRVLQACFQHVPIVNYSPEWQRTLWDAIGAVFTVCLVFILYNFIFDLVFVKVFYIESSRKIQEYIQRWKSISLVLLMAIAFVGGWCFSPIGVLIMQHKATFSGLLRHHFDTITMVYAARIQQLPDIITAFLITQLSFTVLEMLRLTILIKYLLHRLWEPSEHAYLHADRPDYPGSAGIGSRSARIVTTMALTMAFGTLNPYVLVAGIACFAGQTIVYSYLMTFCEPRKAQTNGVFFARTLYQTQICLYLYIVVMAVVLLHRSRTAGPCILAVCSAIPLSLSLWFWRKQFNWDTIPSDILKKDAAIPDQLFNRRSYIQPELCAPLDPKIEDAMVLQIIKTSTAEDQRILNSHGESPSSEVRKVAGLGPLPPALPLRPHHYEIPRQG